MGSPGDKGVDATVGGLVWVQRRNGSWWPGQIIEVEEGSKNLMASPKSGTPIKLLGRDDPIVDWYNLEKSKRVKPFRCGEYDICINKAKLAAANSSRKAVKYARREDAILHALDIEMERESCEIDKLTESEHMDAEFNGFNGSNSPVKDVTEDPNQTRPRRTPNDSEDDGNEGVKRMRGLHDLGMGMDSDPPVKRKKTQVGNFHEFLKRKDRRKSLSKVLESTNMVSVPLVCEKLPCSSELESIGVNKMDSTGVARDDIILGNETDRGFESVLVSCKHRENTFSRQSAIPQKDSSSELFDVPLVSRRTQPADTALNVSNQKPQVGVSVQFGQSIRLKTVTLRNEEVDYSVSTSSDAASLEMGNSKWQSKGKRNSRNVVRIKKNVDEDFNENLEEYWGWSNHSSRKVDSPRDSQNIQRQLPYRQSRSTMNPKYGPEFSMMNHDDSVIDLYDVCLEVKASSRPQHVPYISLRSKLTGQPVIGHPLTVEVLEEGSTGMYTSSFVARKHLKPHCVSPVTSTKPMKSAMPSTKIRTLSSLTGFGRLNGGERSSVAERIMGATVACVPLNIVFSRVNTALSGMTRPRRLVVKPRDQ